MQWRFNKPVYVCGRSDRAELNGNHRKDSEVEKRRLRMWKKPSDSLIILFLCLLNIGDIRAQCERPSVEGNRILAEYRDEKIFPEGATLTYKCSTGYVAVQSGIWKITCEGNQWSTLELQCTGKTCGSPGEISNGKYLTPDGIQFGATAIVQCNEGYIAIGPKTRNCRDFGWDARSTVCEAVKCPAPSTIPDGTYRPAAEVYGYNDAVTYTCNRGYTLFGESVISCSDTGTFYPSPPRCSLVVCDAPVVENAFRVEGKRPPYGYKDIVRYECDEGYTINESGFLVCGETGWNPPPPTCIKKPGPDPRPKPGPDPGPKPGPDPTPEPDNGKSLKIGIGIGVGLLAVSALVVAVILIKKRAQWGKVPTRSERST